MSPERNAIGHPMSYSAGISAFSEQTLLTATRWLRASALSRLMRKERRAIHTDKCESFSIAKTTLKVQIFSIILLFIMFLHR